MKIKALQRNKNKKGGYTLLFSILVASLVLAIGISILSINKKELLLTAGARDSAAAFYAADSGLECALYANDNGVFSSTQDNIDALGSYCNVRISQPVTSSDKRVFTFEARFGSDDGSFVSKACAKIMVDNTPKPNGDRQTIVDSRGYNTGWDERNNTCDTPSSKRVERRIYFKY